MTDDFIRYGILGGKYAGRPSDIAKLFEEGNPKQIIHEPLILSYLNGREEKWPTALEYISWYIELFRQWAYRQADGDKDLLQEIDNYKNGLFEWLNQGSEKGQLNEIELARLKAQKDSLTEKLSDYIPERLISGGHKSIEQMLDDIQNYNYAVNYPPEPSFKWQNSEIKKLCLIYEKIKLLMRLIEKLYSECAAKYHYIFHLDKLGAEIISYKGTLGISRDKLDWGVVDGNIEEHKRQFRLHLSTLKELREEEKQSEKTELNRLQELIRVLKQYRESRNKSTQNDAGYYSDDESLEELEKVKAGFPPIRSVSNLLDKYENQYANEKSIDVIVMLSRAVRSDAGYYSELLNKLSGDEFLRDLEKIKANLENGESYNSAEAGQENEMEKDYKLEALHKSIEHAKRRGYKDDLYQLKIELSTFIVPSYTDFVNSLEIAFKKLQRLDDDFDINDRNNYVSGLLFDKNHEYQFSRKLFQIQESINIITNTTSKALPVLRIHFDQLTKNLIAAIYEAGHNKSPEYYPMNTIGRAWDNMKHFYKLTQNELSSLVKLTDGKIPDQNVGYGKAEKLAEKYEKWASVDTSKPPNGYTWRSFRRAVICEDSYKNLYKEVMNYLLYTKNLDSIEKIRRIHSNLWEIIINSPDHYEGENDVIFIENAELIDKAKQLAALIRDAMELIKPARTGRGQPKNKEAMKSIESLEKLLKDESNLSDMPRGTKVESWEWIADKIKFPINPKNNTPHYKIMQGYLRENSPKLYNNLKSIVKKN